MALVVTIVVLLILAGVTVTYVFSDNGILSRAQTAATETDIATTKEQIQYALLEAIVANRDYTVQDLEEAVEAVTGNELNKKTGIVVSASGNDVNISDLLKGASDYAESNNIFLVYASPELYDDTVVAETVSDFEGFTEICFCDIIIIIKNKICQKACRCSKFN